MKSAITQLTAIATPNGHVALLAVCADGTIWRALLKVPTPDSEAWEEMQPVNADARGTQAHKAIELPGMSLTVKRAETPPSNETQP